jgi:N-acetylglutamate synthase
MPLVSLLPAIEAAAVRGWPAAEAIAVDGWLWRWTSGGSIRANSVATLAYTGSDEEGSIVAIEHLAARRGVPACFAVSDVSAPATLDARLASRGYIRGGDHVTMAAACGVAAPDARATAGVEITTAPTAGWMAAYLSGLSADRRAAAPAILQRLPPSARYIGARLDDRIISSGLTIIDGGLASVQCMATLPEARRRGGAARVLAAIAQVAAGGGATALYLQTGADNATAQALYARHGFVTIGHYHTRTQPTARLEEPARN